MASQNEIEASLNILLQNFMSGRNAEYKEKIKSDLYELYEMTFQHTPDSFLYDGVCEFCKVSTDNYYGSIPPVNTIYQFIQKHYSQSDEMHKEKELDDCPDCERGLRKLCLHLQTPDAFGNQMVSERFYVFACDECEAGKEQYKQGLKNEKQVEEQINKQKNIVASHVSDRYYAHKGEPLLVPDALISDWRREWIADQKKKTNRPNIYLSALKKLEQGMIVRDKLRAEQGLDPI